MKKTTLLIIAFVLTSLSIKAQVLTQSFDAVTLPAGWTQEYVSGTDDWVGVTANGDASITPRTGSHMAEFRTGAYGDATKLVTPSMDISGLTSPQLTFYYANVNWFGDIDELRVFYKTSAAGSWIQIGVDYLAEQTAWTEVSLILPAASADYYIAFEATSNWARGMNLDDVLVGEAPSCLDPISLGVTGVTSSSAILEWTEQGTAGLWNIEYGLAPFAQGAGTAVTGLNVESYGLITLTDNTMYQFYVQADCTGGDESLWVGPFSFSTLCNATNVPFTQDFEAVTTPEIPGCGSVVNDGAGNVWETENNPGAGFTTNVLSYTWNGTNAADTWFYTQGINLLAGTSYTISYNYGNNSTAFIESLEVAYGTGATSVDMVNSLANHATINQNAQQFSSVNFTPIASGVYYFGFHAYSIADQFDLYLDDINIDVTPACQAPVNLAVSNLTDVSADLSWDVTTGNYEYVLDQVATDPAGSGTALAGETYNATSLTAATIYYFHVRTDCMSAWSTIMFTTLETPPVNDDCASPTMLTPGVNFAANAVVGTNVGATDSTGGAIPTGSCASFNGGDVWYSVVVPADGDLTLEVNTETGGITDTGGAAYSGTCGALVEIECNDDGSANGAHPIITISDPLLANETIYFRVWEFGNNATGEFQVSAWNATLSTTDFNKDLKLTFYPNPVGNELSIKSESIIEKVQVFNVLGQSVYTKSFNSNNVNITTSDLNSGAYFVKVISGNKTKTIRVIKN